MHMLHIIIRPPENLTWFGRCAPAAGPAATPRWTGPEPRGRPGSPRRRACAPGPTRPPATSSCPPRLPLPPAAPANYHSIAHSTGCYDVTGTKEWMQRPCFLTRGTGPSAYCTGRQRPSASRSTHASFAASLFSSPSSVYLRQLARWSHKVPGYFGKPASLSRRCTLQKHSQASKILTRCVHASALEARHQLGCKRRLLNWVLQN